MKSKAKNKYNTCDHKWAMQREDLRGPISDMACTVCNLNGLSSTLDSPLEESPAKKQKNRTGNSKLRENRATLKLLTFQEKLQKIKDRFEETDVLKMEETPLIQHINALLDKLEALCPIPPTYRWAQALDALVSVKGNYYEGAMRSQINGRSVQSLDHARGSLGELLGWLSREIPTLKYDIQAIDKLLQPFLLEFHEITMRGK